MFYPCLTSSMACSIWRMAFWANSLGSLMFSLPFPGWKYTNLWSSQKQKSENRPCTKKKGRLVIWKIRTSCHKSVDHRVANCKPGHLWVPRGQCYPFRERVEAKSFATVHFLSCNDRVRFTECAKNSERRCASLSCSFTNRLYELRTSPRFHSLLTGGSFKMDRTLSHSLASSKLCHTRKHEQNRNGGKRTGCNEKVKDWVSAVSTKQPSQRLQPTLTRGWVSSCQCMFRDRQWPCWYLSWQPVPAWDASLLPFQSRRYPCPRRRVSSNPDVTMTRSTGARASSKLQHS